MKINHLKSACGNSIVDEIQGVQQADDGLTNQKPANERDSLPIPLFNYQLGSPFSSDKFASHRFFTKQTPQNPTNYRYTKETEAA
jgi:hypothetical protein